MNDAVKEVAMRAQGNLFSTMPSCQICIAEMAKVTDNDEHQLRSSAQQIKTLKNISSGILIALFFYSCHHPG
jgi:hypothetical protein